MICYKKIQHLLITDPFIFGRNLDTKRMNYKLFTLCINNYYSYKTNPKILKRIFKEIILRRLSKKNNYSAIIKFLPEEYQLIYCLLYGFGHGKLTELQYSNNTFLEIIKDNPKSFKYIPQKYKTERLCLEAVKLYNCLYYIPSDVLTQKICDTSVIYFRSSIIHVPLKYQTGMICRVIQEMIDEMEASGEKNKKIPHIDIDWGSIN